jgi:vanillate O-demethylase monooxygenase subunit
MLEAQQQNLLGQPDWSLLRLNIDAGGFQSRREGGTASAGFATA